jgi:FSR family fosmidomycin resistance protein-like MFS transporter
MSQAPIEKHESSEEKGDRLANYLTMVGHLCTDINQGALTAVLPFLVASNGYSYTAATMLIFASNVASAVIQPLFGWMGDHKARPWFMALGTFLAGLGMCGIGFLTDYRLVVASAMVSGIGVAMFHPEGGRIANLAAGSSKASGMSIFAVGGNMGFFVGPILTSAFLTAFGMHGTLVFLVPAIVCPIVLLAFNQRFKALGVAHQSSGVAGHTQEHWGRFGLLMGVLSIRSILSYGLLAFIPLFLMGVLGQNAALSSLVISAFAIAGGVATLVSGRVSGSVGTHRLIVGCITATVVLTAIFSLNRSLVLAVILAMLLAVSTDLFYPSAVALGMSYVPGHLGTASGLSYGIAVCVGGVAEPFLGAAGDAIGLPPVIMVLAGLAALEAILAIILARLDARRS